MAIRLKIRDKLERPFASQDKVDECTRIVKKDGYERRFEPSGNDWPPDSEATKEAKGHGIVGRDTDRMYNSLADFTEESVVESTDTTLTVGTRTPYAHDFNIIRNILPFNNMSEVARKVVNVVIS